jgi:lipopolysaccharide transport system ATP-binding protein
VNPALAIRAEGLSKSYRLGVGARSHATLRGTASALARRLRRADGRQEPGVFWALRDVSFDIRAGEAVGVIGPNGAGKSTLLKILAQIVAPTRGRAEIRGRLGALLEVGTGFHHELTGRENVFLNGAILGMSRAETAAKLDSIVEFSGVAPFLDTPVKRYSSGMYLRLAFAVAAHVEPEIMIVDEVLAVGDAEFQKRCIAKVQSLAEEGRTVLFVSHQVPLMRSLCSRLIRIDAGTVKADGPTADVLDDYLRDVEARAGTELTTRTHRSGRARVRIAGITVKGEAGFPTTGAPAEFVFNLTGAPVPVECAFTIYDDMGNSVTYFDSAERSLHDGVGDRLSCRVEPLLLRPGRYRLNAALTAPDGVCEDHVEGALIFDVHPGQLEGRSVAAQAGYGSVTMPHRWTRTR